MFDDLLSVLLSELLVLVVSLDGLSNLRDLVLGQIATAVFAIFPGVEAVVRAVRSVADTAEGTMFHALDLKDLLDEGLRRKRCIHG